MSKKEKLFELIHSLNKNEKGYFKKFSGMHTIGDQNQYVKLFDIIEKQKTYDEEAIKKKFHNNSFAKRLDTPKIYLYKLILKSLGNYYTTVDSELRDMLNQIDILFGKGLYEHCKQLLLKLEQKAIQYEKYTYAFEAAQWKNRILLQVPFDEGTKDELTTNYNNSNIYIEKNKSISDYNYLQTETNYLLQQYGSTIRNKNEQKKWDAIMKNPLMKNESKAITLNSKIDMYIVLSCYYSATNDLQRQYQHLIKIEDLFESNRELIIRNINKYITFSYNLLVNYLRLKRYNEFFHALQKFKNISTSYTIKLSTRLEMRIFGVYTLELSYYFKTWQFEKIDTVINDIEQGLIRYDGKFFKTSELILKYNIACLYLINKKYKKSLVWINKILNDNTNLTKEHAFIYFSRLFKLILYYELEYIEELPYVVKSTYRFFVKKKKMYKVEESILNFLRKSIKISGKKELTNAFIDLKKEIVIIAKDPFEKKMLDDFDIVSWLESKIENRPFADVLRGKAHLLRPGGSGG